MTERRPLPEYGEYATPEQQAAAMGKRLVPDPVPHSAQQTPAASPRTAPRAERLTLVGHPVDRFVTIFLFGVGLVSLINSNYFQFSEAYNAVSEQLGTGGTVPVSFDHLGWLLLAVNIALYLASLAWAFLRINRGRLAFFVPIAGAAAFYAFMTALLTITIYG